MIARKILRDALIEASNSFDSAATVADAAYSIDDWETTDKALEVVSRLDPEGPNHGVWALALQSLGGLLRRRKCTPERCNGIQKTSSLSWDVPRHVQSKRYDDAIGDCQQAVNLEAGSARPFNYWGRCLSAQRRDREAIEKFEQADRLKPGDSELLTLWSGSLNALGLYDEAMEKAREAIKADQTNADAFYELGRSLWRTNRLSEADERFQTAYELDRTRADILSSWGVLLSTLGRHDDAIDKFERANHLGSRRRLHVGELGEEPTRLGRYQASVDKCRKALTLEPENADAHLNLAHGLTELGDVDDALNHFQKPPGWLQTTRVDPHIVG